MTSSPTASQSSWSLIDEEETNIASSSTSTLDHNIQPAIGPTALPDLDENDILRSRISDLELKNTIYEQQIKEHEYTTFNQSEEIAEIRQRLNELEDERIYISAGLDPSRKELESDIRKLELSIGEEGDKTRNEMLIEYKKHLKSNGENIEPSKKDFAELEVISSNQSKRIKELTNQLNQMNDENYQKELLNYELQYIIQSIEIVHIKVNNELKELGIENHKLDNYIHSINNIEKRYKKKLEERGNQLKVEYENKQNDIKLENDKNLELKTKNKKTEKEIKHLKKNNDKLSKIIEKVKSENDDMTTQLEESQVEIDRLKEEIKDKLKIVEK
ncbi:uncharacterized protein I206_105617 [Kwoniella pini CBS 10737]|uniref:Uncharacterized protein n=1 Tax=Kwoniella pini CBS 10737 TaxID=1296096 RepID=A0A1B9I3R0_9TREE|nr:uncharacterized protein I206_03483 [Kwoniella pini CBS 10737]OCF50164.1 hypothetical protein I206_03483 [Kwoniella pini CBS 10737]